jgi:hypothetical protein
LELAALPASPFCPLRQLAPQEIQLRFYAIIGVERASPNKFNRVFSVFLSATHGNGGIPLQKQKVSRELWDRSTAQSIQKTL